MCLAIVNIIDLECGKQVNHSFLTKNVKKVNGKWSSDATVFHEKAHKKLKAFHESNKEDQMGNEALKEDFFCDMVDEGEDEAAINEMAESGEEEEFED